MTTHSSDGVCHCGYDPSEDVETDSDTEEPEGEDLIYKCSRDIRRAIEHDRFKVETPTRSVEQTTLRSLGTSIRQPTTVVHCGGRPMVEAGPSLLGLTFHLPADYSGVNADLSYQNTDVTIYGDQHTWELADPWSVEITHQGFAVGEEVYYSHDHEWGAVEEIDWR
jgi:hypothetical protein